jgi:hypothetical protein
MRQLTGCAGVCLVHYNETVNWNVLESVYQCSAISVGIFLLYFQMASLSFWKFILLASRISFSRSLSNIKKCVPYVEPVLSTHL